MNKKEIDIKNGVKLNMIGTDRFKMSRLSISFVYDADELKSPLRKLMFSILMRGSQNYPSVAAINRALDDLYGSTVSFRCSADGDRHVFTFVCEMLDERYIYNNDNIDILHGTLEILKDILLHPLTDGGILKEEFIRGEKKNAADAIRSKANDQRAYSAEKCRRIMFRGEKCGISADGNEDMIYSFTPNQLTECHRHMFNDATVTCFYIGSKSEDIVKKEVNELFTDVKFSDEVRKGYTPYASTRDIIFENEEKAVAQSRLNIGMRMGVVMSDREYYAAGLFNEIFGGSSTSKLFMNVREKKSLCYYCSSVYMVSKGAIFVSCGTNADKRDAVYDEIMSQLDEMKIGNFTEEEISVAKKQMINSFKQVSDSPSGLDSYYFRRDMAGIGLTPSESIDMVKAVTREDIMNIAKRTVPDTVYFLGGSECEEAEGYDE